MKKPLLIFTLAFFWLATIGQAQDSSLSELAKKTGVLLKVTSNDDDPPNTPIGIIIPAGWKPKMKSFDNCRALLKAMPARRVLNIRGPIKADVLKRLSKIVDEFDGMRINRIPVVSVGIQMNSTLLIIRVAHEDSGLKAGDKVLQVNETPIGKFPELRLALCDFVPGDEIKLVVLREGAKKKISVKLSKPLIVNNE